MQKLNATCKHLTSALQSRKVRSALEPCLYVQLLRAAEGKGQEGERFPPRQWAPEGWGSLIWAVPLSRTACSLQSLINGALLCPSSPPLGLGLSLEEHKHFVFLLATFNLLHYSIFYAGKKKVYAHIFEDLILIHMQPVKMFLLEFQGFCWIGWILYTAVELTILLLTQL